MKSFAEYLTESKKTYPFKIGVAGELPEGFDNRLETMLEKYGVLNMTPGKKTPIQKRPLDFPQLENVDVTYYEIELQYPTTVQVLEQYLQQSCNIDEGRVIVRNPNEPQELYQQEKEDEEYVAKLTQEDMGGESAQEDVAGNRVMNLLKELETARKDRDIDPTADTPKGESKDIGDAENTKSPIGA
jgi:hypothetical protein